MEVNFSSYPSPSRVAPRRHRRRPARRHTLPHTSPSSPPALATAAAGPAVEGGRGCSSPRVALTEGRGGWGRRLPARRRAVVVPCSGAAVPMDQRRSSACGVADRELLAQIWPDAAGCPPVQAGGAVCSSGSASGWRLFLRRHLGGVVVFGAAGGAFSGGAVRGCGEFRRQKSDVWIPPWRKAAAVVAGWSQWLGTSICDVADGGPAFSD